MSGQITDVNAWCRSFTTNEMIKWNDCDPLLADPDLGELSILLGVKIALNHPRENKITKP